MPSNAQPRHGPRGGYTVFGKVIDGMDVVDAIAKVRRRPTKMDTDGQPKSDVPVKPVLIKSHQAEAS